MQTFILKFSDRMPIIIGMNEQSSKLRFGLNVASNADDTTMVPSTKRAKFDDEALAGSDAENSTFAVLDGNIFMVMCDDAPDKTWQSIGLAPVPKCTGIYTSMLSSPPCTMFSIANSDVDVAYRADLISDIVKKSNELHLGARLAQDVKHAWLWLRPGKAVQVLLAFSDDALIWSSLQNIHEIETATRAHGKFSAYADNSAWEVTFHFKGLDDKAQTSKLRQLCGPNVNGLTFSCTVGGRTGNILYEDAVEDHHFCSIKAWAVCAVRFK